MRLTPHDPAGSRMANRRQRSFVGGRVGLAACGCGDGPGAGRPVCGAGPGNGQPGVDPLVGRQPMACRCGRHVCVSGCGHGLGLRADIGDCDQPVPQHRLAAVATPTPLDAGRAARGLRRGPFFSAGPFRVAGTRGGAPFRLAGAPGLGDRARPSWPDAGPGAGHQGKLVPVVGVDGPGV